MTFLETILAAKRAEVSSRKKDHSLRSLRDKPLYSRSAVSLSTAIRSSAPAIIAELKKASPSRGTIRRDFDVPWLASGYQGGGACAISVLTDERFFAGSLNFLEAARNTVSVPLLRKDFILEEYQIHEAKAYGADAVLLIVAALPGRHLADLLECAESLGLEALVEVHSEREADQALRAKATIIGINNRDLHTFTVDLGTTTRILPVIPSSITVVSESGIGSVEDIRRLVGAGAHGFLMGESLMNEERPGEKLKSIIREYRTLAG
jgi:indole-3-glycerol phosphate synthase